MGIFRIPPPIFVGGHQPYDQHDPPPPVTAVVWFQMDSSTMPDIIPVKREMVAY